MIPKIVLNLSAIFLFLNLSGINLVNAQDAQLSQFYASPLYLNPGLTGATLKTRIGMNYRNQWPALEANFTTYSLYGDHYLDDYNSGVGFMIMSDNVKQASISSNSINLFYSYRLNLPNGFVFMPGVRFGYVFQSANYSNLLFGDMIDPSTGVINQSSADLNTNTVNYFDLGFGGVIFKDNFWLGVAGDHLTNPNISAFGGDNDNLSIKYSVHGGYKFSFFKHKKHIHREFTFTPTFIFKKQGVFSQLDLGTYFAFDPIEVGFWYRGVPYNEAKSGFNNESLVFLLGISHNDFNFGYSFDYTISDLGISAGGAHELSISYTLFTGDPRKPPKNVRKLPCPQF